MAVAATDLWRRARQAWGPAMDPAAELTSSNAAGDWRATVAKWQLSQSSRTRAAEGCLPRCCYCYWFILTRINYIRFLHLDNSLPHSDFRLQQ